MPSLHHISAGRMEGMHSGRFYPLGAFMRAGAARGKWNKDATGHVNTAHIHLYLIMNMPTVRNVAPSAPYMHNGAFGDLKTVVGFYDKGEGLGLEVPSQTLPSDGLDLSDLEIADLVLYMESITDTLGHTSAPAKLSAFANTALNKRTAGGEY